MDRPITVTLKVTAWVDQGRVEWEDMLGIAQIRDYQTPVDALVDGWEPFQIQDVTLNPAALGLPGDRRLEAQLMAAIQPQRVTVTHLRRQWDVGELALLTLPHLDTDGLNVLGRILGHPREPGQPVGDYRDTLEGLVT